MDERWQEVLTGHVCDQAPLRSALMGRSCADERVRPLGMRCLPGFTDMHDLRMAADHAMKDPAQKQIAD